jgi:hypothetical protein
MRIQASSIDEYLKKLPADRREAISKVRDVVRANLPAGYVEGLQYGMISYYIPLETFSNTYNGYPLATVSIASQKNHMAVYLMGLYADAGGEQWFRDAGAKSGAKKLDMGRACVRFRKLEDISLDTIGAAVKRVTPQKFIEAHNKVHGDKLPKKVAAAKRAIATRAGAKSSAKTKNTATKKSPARRK